MFLVLCQICSCLLLPKSSSSAGPSLACCPCCAQLLLCPPPASPSDRDFLVFSVTLQPPTKAFFICYCAFLEQCGHRTATSRESSPQHAARVWMFPEPVHSAGLPCCLVALLGMAGQDRRCIQGLFPQGLCRGVSICLSVCLLQGGPGHLYLLKNKVATFAKVEKEEDLIL